MIPQGGSITQGSLQRIQQPSRTYSLDTGQAIDGLDAVKQAVYKILQTERFRHIIYTANYGREFKGLFGNSPAFVQSECARRVREALMQDDRIKDVQDIQVTVTGDSATVIFTVVSQYGTFPVEQEVS